VSVLSEGGRPNADSWGVDSRVRYVFPPTPQTAETLTLRWYDGDQRPPAEVKALLGGRELSDQGSIYIGTDGVLYSPYISDPVLLPAEKFVDYKAPRPDGDDHYLQFVEACRGERQNLHALLVRRSADRDGPARLPCDPVPGDDPGMGRGEHEGHELGRGEPVRQATVSGRLAGRRAVSRGGSGSTPGGAEHVFSNGGPTVYRRFTIAKMLILVAFAGIAIASLCRPNGDWFIVTRAVGSRVLGPGRCRGDRPPREYPSVLAGRGGLRGGLLVRVQWSEEQSRDIALLLARRRATRAIELTCQAATQPCREARKVYARPECPGPLAVELLAGEHRGAQRRPMDHHIHG